MTLANKITLTRIGLIPVFILLAVGYGAGIEDGAAQEWMRWAAIGVFVLAAATDGLDGWVARRWGHRSRLGAVLDPVADKGLLFAAIITLSVSPWRAGFPGWFPVLVIGRDVLILGGCFFLKRVKGTLEVRPTWAGKIATALQMTSVAWILLHLPRSEVLIWAAGLFTLYSGMEYFLNGVRLLFGSQVCDAKKETADERAGGEGR